MKGNLLRILLLITLAIVAGYWLLFSPATNFSAKTQAFYITDSTTDKVSVLAEMEKMSIVKSTAVFSLVASPLGIWEKIRPGKYEVKKGQNLIEIARMLKNGRQAEVKLVINKVRTPEELAKLISKNFMADSSQIMQFITSNDSLKPFGVDTSHLFTLIIPDTYAFYWNASLQKILHKIADTQKQFWQRNNRLEKASAIGLNPEEVYTLASIVEEETNYDSDKLKIASVYLNRLHRGMPLQACPTIKYAMKDFTLTRIYEKYLVNPSPYNTYRYKGLPPGPICTPSPKTIDLILDAPKTGYLYFVAKSDFSGYHHFSDNYGEHNRYAKEYQKALDEYMVRKQQNKPGS